MLLIFLINWVCDLYWLLCKATCAIHWQTADSKDSVWTKSLEVYKSDFQNEWILQTGCFTEWCKKDMWTCTLFCMYISRTHYFPVFQSQPFTPPPPPLFMLLNILFCCFFLPAVLPQVRQASGKRRKLLESTSSRCIMHRRCLK